MSGCSEVKAKFTEYLDGRLNGREMQRIAAHLESCRSVPGSGSRCARCSRRCLAWGRCRSRKICCCGFAWPSARSGRAAAAASSRLWIWPGKTPSVRSCCRPRPALPARCCCWVRSSCWSPCLPSLKRRRPPRTSRWATPPRRGCVSLSSDAGQPDWRHLRPGGGRGLCQRRGPGVRLSHRLRTRRSGHPLAD